MISVCVCVHRELAGDQCVCVCVHRELAGDQCVCTCIYIVLCYIY